MQQVPIQQLANQSFSIILDNNEWSFILKTVQDMTVATISLNGTTVIESTRCAAGSLIIPAKYEEAGNFFFTTANSQLPFYTAFNVTQSLIYVSQAELDQFRAPKPLPITAADFNPLGALPLRFSPQGY